MNQLEAALAFFAAPGEQQARALPSLPADSGARDFHASFARNPLLLLVEAYHRYLRHSDDESWQAFEERLGLPPSDALWPESIAEFNYVLETIRPGEHTLWGRKALERRVEWRVVRRLATIVLQDFGWRARVSAPDVQALVARYGPMLESEWREEGRTW